MLVIHGLETVTGLPGSVSKKRSRRSFVASRRWGLESEYLMTRLLGQCRTDVKTGCLTFDYLNKVKFDNTNTNR